MTKARIVTKKNFQGEKIEVAQPGGIFTKSNILEILNNRVYIGFRKLHNEYFQGIQKAIVAADKFGKAKKLIESNSKYSQLETQIKNITEKMANDSNTKNSEEYLDPANKLPVEIGVIAEEIRKKARLVDQIQNYIVDKNILKVMLINFIEILAQ